MRRKVRSLTSLLNECWRWLLMVWNRNGRGETRRAKAIELDSSVFSEALCGALVVAEKLPLLG